MKRTLPLLMLFVWLPMRAQGQIAHDADSKSANCGDVASCTWNHTVTGSNSILWVGCGINAGYNIPLISSVTFKGVALKQVQYQRDTRDYFDLYLFELIGPPAGQNPIKVTLSKKVGTTNGFFCAASSFTGSDQSSLDNTGAIKYEGDTQSVDISLQTSNANAWIIDATVHSAGNGVGRPNAPQVQTDAVGPSAMAFDMSFQGPVSTPRSVSDGWSLPSYNSNWLLTAASMKPAGATTKTGQTDPLSSANFPSIDQNSADYPSNVWVTGPLAKVFQNTGTPGSTKWAIVYGTQNEIQSFQVHVQAPGTGLSNVNVTMSDLVNAATGTHISAVSTDIVVYRELYQNIANMTSIAPTYYGTTGYVPDILMPAVDPYYHQATSAFPFALAANQNQSIWIDVHIPSSAPSGYYAGTVSVKSGSDTLATLPVVYAVWQWPNAGSMPSTATLQSYTDISYGGFCDIAYGSVSGCAAYPGSGGNPDVGITMTYVDAAVQMLDNRYSLGGAINIYPQSGSFASFTSVYGPLLNGTTAHVPNILSGAKWTSTALKLSESLNASGSATFQNFATTFSDNGWFPALFYYLCDEPPNGCTWPTLVSNGNAENGYSSPTVPKLVTTNIANATTNNALSSIDWMVPIINDLDPQGGSLQRPAYDTWLSGNTIRRLWSYQSCESAGTCGNGTTGTAKATWPNLHVDGLPVANRAMEWMSYLHNQTGELYYYADICDYAANCGYPSKVQDPFATVYYAGGNGDGTLIYPCSTSRCGTTTPIWLPSMRLKMIRDGMQDYEYLYKLNASGQGAVVTSQIASWITNSYTFNVDPAGLTAARQTLGTSLHQLTYPAAH